MGRYAFKFGAEHRDAIRRYVVEGGMPATKFVREAKAGTLEGIDAFDISDQRVRDIAGQIRAERVQAKFDAETDEIKKGLKVSAHIATERLMRMATEQQKRTDRAGFDHAELASLAGTLKKLEGEKRQPSNGQPSPDNGALTDDPAEKERRALEARLNRAPKAKQHTEPKASTDSEPKQDNTQRQDPIDQAGAG